ncbi:DUF2513 domain-containing protein [Cerasicoccus fimbriatus]|uniref:DUF2513 domain-containing protein n=1 Tax=Cerasicoccus fimbriatus TaxID=3014554 RepID=UPI0022B2C32C|nr:DUF2513 domain-containing protein [Cerasicoccus sp. TK19100]
MKRDWDLIRSILLCLEHDRDNEPIESILSDVEHLSNWTEEEQYYHMALLIEAGYAIGPVDELEDTTLIANCERMTWAGHDLLDSIRDKGIWEKTKSGASQIGGWSIEIIKDLATAYIKQQAKEKLGFDL